MLRNVATACVLTAVAALAGCGTRSLLLMKPLPPTYAWQRADGGTAAPARRPSFDSALADARAPLRTNGRTGAADPRAALGANGRDGDGVVPWAGLPAPHLAPRSKTPVETPSSIARARALVGQRDPRPPLAFALTVAAGLTHARALPDPADGPALVAWADARHLLVRITPGATAPPDLAAGDLVVFDRAVGGAPASLVAVVLGHDARGVFDLLYLGGGVIRLGHLDPTRPKTARDHDGRSVNTYLRHNRDEPPAGTRFLTGELLSSRLRLPSR
ncbi:MAG TPA: hypothetical protein VHE35_05905 [Kofleriaceae bacterium]|nr:hypothetical protein [Kofleriaceae bacterium]